MNCERYGIHILCSLWCAMLIAGLLFPAATAATIGADADSWVREDSPDSNRSGDAFMNARTDSDADDNDVALLRFNLATLVGPTSGASLYITWYRSDGSTGKTLSLWGVNDSSPDDIAWDETAVTYNNAPGLIPDGIDPTAEGAAGHTDADIHDLDISNLTQLVADQGYGPQVEGELYTFLGAALDTFLDADTNGVVTFLITRNTDTSSNQARFIQKEATTYSSGAAVPAGGAGAYLDGVTVIPEPASITLIGLCAFAMILRRLR